MYASHELQRERERRVARVEAPRVYSICEEQRGDAVVSFTFWLASNGPETRMLMLCACVCVYYMPRGGFTLAIRRAWCVQRPFFTPLSLCISLLILDLAPPPHPLFKAILAFARADFHRGRWAPTFYILMWATQCAARERKNEFKNFLPRKIFILN